MVSENGILEWDPDELLHHAQPMSQLKKKSYETAKVNIDAAQARDKIYYDLKCGDSKVIYVIMFRKR